jgi:hypothetical protein
MQLQIATIFTLQEEEDDEGSEFDESDDDFE